jgi:hypothetical protein
VRRALPRRAKLSALAVSDPVPAPREWDAILLAVPDSMRLRTAVSGLTTHGRAARIGVLLAQGPTQPPVPAPRADWPAVRRVMAVSESHCFVGLEFDGVAPSASVLADIARLGRRDPTLQWPVVGTLRFQPDHWLPADGIGPVSRSRRLLDASVDFPPDVAFVSPGVDGGGSSRGSGTEQHHVLARSPVVVTRPDEPAWSEADERTPLDPLALGPVDERLVNPIGFDKTVTGSAVELTFEDAAQGIAVPRDGRVGDAETNALRSAAGLRLTWRGGTGPVAYCRAVLRLAAAGIPLVCEVEPPPWARQLLPPELVAVLGEPADLDDALRREERSIRMRRASLRACSMSAWRASLAAREGLQVGVRRNLSVLLATMRPERLEFALRQVARQRGLDALELVLVTHGFEAAAESLERFRSSASHIDLVPVPVPPETAFGDVLNRGLVRASGDLVAKMDDDDWYGPDFLADLVLAKQYSGADLVGSSSEFTYVAPLSVTARRGDPSEVYRPWVAGGTLMLERSFLRGLGGFRSTRQAVDASVLRAVRAVGGVTYRTHGLGYVLRRERQGHTWDPGVEYFVEASRAPWQWPGFAPSVLLEPVAEDLPVPMDAEPK